MAASLRDVGRGVWRGVGRAAGPFLLVVILIAAAWLAAGAVPPVALAAPAAQGLVVPWTGQLLGVEDAPVVDGFYAFRFGLHGLETGGAPLWSELHEQVPVRGGEFTVLLGAQTPLPELVGVDAPLWLEVAVRGLGETEFVTLAPRQLFLLKGMGGDGAAGAAGEGVDADPRSCAHGHWGEVWSNSSSSLGLSVLNNGTGDGIRAFSKATSPNYGAIYAVNTATTGDGSGIFASSIHGSGVRGYSTTGVGVTAISLTNDGVAGRATGNYKSGLYGYHTALGYGLFGRSAGYFGLGSDGAGDGSGYDAVGDLLLAGNRGEIFSAGPFLNLYSNFNANIDLDNDNNDANACFFVYNGADAVVGRMCENGTKSAVLQTEDYGARAVYSMESPEVWLEDFGTAALANGEAFVPFEPIFAQMINTQEAYHVFVTPLGEGNGLFVAEKRADGFVVRELGGGTGSVAFDWRVAAKRLGVEALRTEELQAASIRK